MWNSYAKINRLVKALKYRELDPERLNIVSLMEVLRHRGITDNSLNSLVWEIITVLEPPGCHMTHCKHYGNSPAFCNCSGGKMPGRCKIHKTYIARKKEREKKRIGKIKKAIQDTAAYFMDRDVVRVSDIKTKTIEFGYDIDKSLHIENKTAGKLILGLWHKQFTFISKKRGYRINKVECEDE